MKWYGWDAQLHIWELHILLFRLTKLDGASAHSSIPSSSSSAALGVREDLKVASVSSQELLGLHLTWDGATPPAVAHRLKLASATFGNILTTIDVS